MRGADVRLKEIVDAALEAGGAAVGTSSCCSAAAPH
jgi:hypothetical protein